MDKSYKYIETIISYFKQNYLDMCFVLGETNQDLPIRTVAALVNRSLDKKVLKKFVALSDSTTKTLTVPS